MFKRYLDVNHITLLDPALGHRDRTGEPNPRVYTLGNTLAGETGRIGTFGATRPSRNPSQTTLKISLLIASCT